MFTPWSVLRRCCTSLFLFFASVLYLAAQELPAGKAIGSATKPNAVVYKLKAPQGSQLRLANGSMAVMQAALQQVGAKSVKQKFPDKMASPASRKGAVDLSLIYELDYHPGQRLEEVQRTLMATGMVAYVEPLYQRVPLYQPNDPASDSTKTSQSYLKLIKAYGAWAVEKGDTNIVIGVLDTGFRLTHEDIRRKVKFNYDDPIDGVDNDGDGLIDNFQGWDFADKDNDPIDDTPWRGHGVGVAGAAAGDSDNGVGMASVGFNTKFLPLKVFPSTQTGSFAGYEAIVYAADKGCSIINLSWGGEGSSQYEQDIINYAVFNRDVVIVAAGGNTNAMVNIFPAAYDNVLSVGGITNDVKTNGHTWNYKIDLTAPSANIYTTSQSRDNAYAGSFGTSFASPLVAGAAGLVRSRHPYLNAMQVMERLRVTSDNIYHLEGNAPYYEMLGKGRLNVKRAVTDKSARSVRCTSFEIAGGKVAQIGDTLLLHIKLTNYLDPTSALQVRLSSSSPYVTILQDEFVAGSMATMATTHNTNRPYRIVVNPNAPHNTLVAFRLGFTDGNYSDFQYFQLPVNPDHMTLTANNLHITLNSKGNLGYNAFNFRQGVGIRYKGSSSLMFEGGLLVATGPTRVSDNVRNASWQTDNDFVPLLPTRMHYNTARADQEIRGVMRDKHPDPGQAGVQVWYKGMASGQEADADYVILEYYIQNITEDTIQNLNAGLFTDWNIGDQYLNIADWDDELRLGYVYNLGFSLPYAGIKLLNTSDPSYYAIDNLAGGSSTFAIADGFSTQEKHRALSGGVARKKAWGNGTGNDVSHVVGSAFNKVPPGATRIVAFAVVAGDDLPAIKKHAAAAQQRYQRLKSGPVPLAQGDTVCAGTAITISPAGGSSFKFYADEAKETLLAMGSSLELPSLSQSTVVYVCNADSLFDSPLLPVAFSVPAAPEARFSILQSQNQYIAGKAIKFRNESLNGNRWLWKFGNGETSTDQHPEYNYTMPGEYLVQLLVTDAYDCAIDSVSQQVKVLAPEPTVLEQDIEKMFQLFPNPAQHELHLTLPAAGMLPDLMMTDVVGKEIIPQLKATSAKEAVYDLVGAAEGIYIVRITYKDQTLTKRLMVVRK